MRKPSLPTFLKVAVLTLLPAAAVAEPMQEWRCSVDSLTPEQAQARIEWARKCGLTQNLNPAGPNSWFLSGKAFDTNFDWAKEYKEFNTNRAWTGNLNQYNVNYYHAFSKYDNSPMYTVSAETSGPTANYFKWSHTSSRPRTLYPSFENSPVAGSGTQLFPHPTLNNCNLYSDATGTTVWNTNFYVIAYCESSCYAPDQKVLFSDGETNLLQAMQQGREDVITLGANATLDDLQLTQGKVYSYTSETRDSEHLLYHLRTASGGELKVTNEHPVVTREGRLVQAQTLKVGDELLRHDGTPDAIVSVEKSTHFGKVYNLKPESREQVSNILVAQGFLVGSARFQNDDIEYMNRVLLYRGVPEDVLPQ
ncbi:cell surface protein [Corallococcus sp. CA047B]|uniref:Hint domain-containing protein n=1 Tax=Corallococcus sp. CA047B TaxID=2316729 RepID=UPI000EA20732|nr:Hint domain-containing protein [Corallococcus sp. CA047B]RKH17026.1 cell surface protein [Corallococcus sp. CA047B]